MIDSVIRLLVVLSIISWVSFTVFIIVPKLQGIEMTVGLGMIIGIITAAFTWMEKVKSKERTYKIKHQEKNNEKS